MKKLYNTVEELNQKCQVVFNKLTKNGTIAISPRYFRTEIKVSKFLLSTWRNSNPIYFNLIKSYEDKLLALLENMIIEKVNAKAKTNITGLIFLLRAYDRERYIPELATEKEEEDKPILIIKPNKEDIVLNDAEYKQDKNKQSV